MESSVVWAVPVADSGSLKTPAYDAATSALYECQGKALRQHDEAIADYERESDRYDADLRAWKTSGRKAGQPMPEKPIEPTARRCLVSDVTVEAIAAILGNNPRGVLLARDELSGWLGGFDREGTQRLVAHWGAAPGRKVAGSTPTRLRRS